MQHRFSTYIGKHTAPAYQNTLTFDQYPFNSRSDINVNIVYPKKAILLTFLGQTTHFISEKQKKTKKNLHRGKAGLVAVILNLRAGVQHIQKWFNKFSNAVAVK